eukprot:TRINITY_DN3851_c0_g1_i1.p1 TRINITY_DN3851_c0_g1~~TRINITY_DN3851_c0_g1_i1.p1  ORF type:complete len:371 (+),score=107.44 TRINITY_DN3851_c0_g1_i1:62-1174(+)
MSCEAPFTGAGCSESYANSAGSAAFWGYRALYFILGALLGLASVYELKATASETPVQRVVNPTMQQNYQKSVYLRLIAASVVFIICAIDPLGYDNIIGIDIWLILSGVTSFFVLSVCISLIFVVVRRIALVGSQHGVLSYFNCLYVYSQAGMLVTWVALPIVQVFVPRGYLVEAVKLSLSSLIFLTWTIGSLGYGVSAIRKLKQSAPDKKIMSSNNLSGTLSSDVCSQRLASLKVLVRLLMVASALSILFVGVQAVDAAHAIKTQDDVNFDAQTQVPANFGDLFIAGIFETIKQLFCFVVLGGMRYVRITKHHTRSNIFAADEEEHGGENIPLAELPETKNLKKDEEQDDDELSSSQTSILASDSHNAAA